MFVMTK